MDGVGGGVAELGQHHVVAIAAVIADRELFAAGREVGAFGKAGEVADDRIAAIVADDLETRALVRMQAAEECQVEHRAGEVDGTGHVDLVEAMRPRIGPGERDGKMACRSRRRLPVCRIAATGPGERMPPPSTVTLPVVP